MGCRLSKRYLAYITNSRHSQNEYCRFWLFGILSGTKISRAKSKDIINFLKIGKPLFSEKYINYKIFDILLILNNGKQIIKTSMEI